MCQASEQTTVAVAWAKGSPLTPGKPGLTVLNPREASSISTATYRRPPGSIRPLNRQAIHSTAEASQTLKTRARRVRSKPGAEYDGRLALR